MSGIQAILSKKHLPTRRQAVKVSSAVLIVGAVAAAWALMIWGGQINMKDPAAVAVQFVSELQANRPNSAYSLTSSSYHKAISENDFTKNVASDLNQQLPKSTPQFVKKSLPPKDSKIKNQARIEVHVPDDATHAGDHTVQVLMAEDTQSGQWFIQAFTSINNDVGKG